MKIRNFSLYVIFPSVHVEQEATKPLAAQKERAAGVAALTACFCHSLCRDVCFHFSTKTELYKAAMITQLLNPKISCMSTPQRNGGLESGWRLGSYSDCVSVVQQQYLRLQLAYAFNL